MSTKSIKSYRDLIRLPTFEERLDYLRLKGTVGKATFGIERYLNQDFYHSTIWKQIRHRVITRDEACNLGLKDYDIRGLIYVHHIDPITIEDLADGADKVFDLDNLICCDLMTHNAIHYGTEVKYPPTVTERRRNDTCPWRV